MASKTRSGRSDIQRDSRNILSKRPPKSLAFTSPHCKLSVAPRLVAANASSALTCDSPWESLPQGASRERLAHVRLVRPRQSRCSPQGLGPTIADLKEARTIARLRNLSNAITSAGALPAGAQLIDAHSCEFQGRRFAHLVVTYHSQVVSVLVAKTDGPNRSAPRPGTGDLVANVNSNPYRIAYVGTERHAIFVFVRTRSERQPGDRAERRAGARERFEACGRKP